MLIGRTLAILLFPYMGLVVPIYRVLAARERKDTRSVLRWCSFLTCTLLFVVPISIALPVWFLFYYDVIWCLLAILSAYDAAVSEFIVVNYINPQVAQLRMVVVYTAFLATAPHRPVNVTSDDSSDEGEDERNE